MNEANAATLLFFLSNSDHFLPIDFLKYDVADGKGLPYIRERAAGKIYKWMNRILMKRVGRHFALWIKLVMWFRWLRKVKRGLKAMVRVSRRISMRKWKLHTFLHREAERLRAAIVLQRLIRGHFGRKKAYRQLRINAAHAIQGHQSEEVLRAPWRRRCVALHGRPRHLRA